MYPDNFCRVSKFYVLLNSHKVITFLTKGIYKEISWNFLFEKDTSVDVPMSRKFCDDFFFWVLCKGVATGTAVDVTIILQKSACFWQVVVRFDIKFKELDIKSIIGHHNECSTKRTKRKSFVDLDFKIKTKLFIKRLR